MNKIKFSHKTYFKLQRINVNQPVRLLLVYEVNKKDLCNEFIDYDTKFQSSNGIESYQLPNATLIILTFIDIAGNLFTTVRRWDIDKLYYYKQNIGQSFKIEFDMKGAK